MLDVGARGDGTTDDTAALQKALDEADGRIVVIPAGAVCAHHEVLRLREDGVHLAGPGTLLATNPDRATVWVTANNVTIDGQLTIRATNLKGRRSAPWNNGLTLDGYEYGRYRGATVKEITIDGSAAAGLMVNGHTDYLIQDVTIQNTLADGLHQTHGAARGRVIRPTIRNTADDGVAVISYRRDGVVCHQITIESPRFFGSTNGRAFTVVGGEEITWTDVFAENSDAAAIYVGSESGWDTYPSRQVRFLGGTLVHANQGKEPDHGAVLLLSSQAGQTQEDITLDQITIRDAPTYHRQVGAIAYNGGGFARVVLRNFTILGGPTSVYSGNYTGAGVTRTGWTRDGVPLPDAPGK